MLSQREMLDQLMGKDRNLLEEDKKILNQHWSDDAICKYFLCGFCPHDLFYNTKSDLGQCQKLHDEHIRQKFQAESESRRRGVEANFMRFLQTLCDDVDRRKRRGTDRLNTPLQPDVSDPVWAERQKQIDELKTQVLPLIEQMEKLGEEGNVDQAVTLLTLVNELEQKRKELEEEHNEKQKIISDFEKKMGVCEVCGAFLVQNEAESRIQSHLNGKQHIGFAMIREKLVEMRLKPTDHSQPPPPSSDSAKAPRRSRSPPRRRRDSPPRRSSNSSAYSRDHRSGGSRRSRSPRRRSGGGGSGYRDRR